MEIMLTNGLNHWSSIVNMSQADPPYVISGMSLSTDNQNLIVYYQVKNMDS